MEAGGRRLMARGEAWRGARGLGAVGSHCRRSPKRKVSCQTPGDGANAGSQGAHARGKAGETGGSLGRGRGRRGQQAWGSRAQGLQLQHLGCARAQGSAGGCRPRLPSPPSLPSEVPVIEHLLAVRVQGPVIPFTCRRKGPAQKTRGVTAAGVDTRNGGDFSTTPPPAPPGGLTPALDLEAAPCTGTGVHSQPGKNADTPGRPGKGDPREIPSAAQSSRSERRPPGLGTLWTLAVALQ